MQKIIEITGKGYVSIETDELEMGTNYREKDGKWRADMQKTRSVCREGIEITENNRESGE